MSASHPSVYGLRSNRVVTPEGVQAATVVIGHGLVVGVWLKGEAFDQFFPSEVTVEDLGDLVIFPGVIDAHVHVNEPGTDWEGFETATRAASAGGVTTIVDMPLNSLPVTTTVSALEAKRSAAAGKCWVDVGLYGGLVAGNADQMQALCAAGILGIKAFLCHSGLDEFPNATERDLREAMPTLAKKRVPLLVHAELLDSPAPVMTDVRSFSQFVASRPVRWELSAIELLIRLCREFRCHVHVVHLATGAALPMLAAAKGAGLPITVETCPHYLFFENSSVADGDTRFKCAPPIRPGAAAELWAGLQAGTIDTIGSDHSPCPPALKMLDTGDFSRAWGGIASLQLSLSTTWSYLLRKQDGDLVRLANWLSLEPAKLVGLAERKGRIKPGYDADLAIWDPEAKWRIDGQQLLHRHQLTAYDRCEVTGRVVRTYVRGQLVFRDGQVLGRPVGQLVSRQRSGY